MLVEKKWLGNELKLKRQQLIEEQLIEEKLTECQFRRQIKIPDSKITKFTNIPIFYYIDTK